MKKSVIFIILGLLLLTTFCLAEEINEGEETTSIGENTERTELPSIKNLTQNITFHQRLNEFLLKERTIPTKIERIKKPILGLFNLEENKNLNVHYLSFIAIFVTFLFLVFYQFMKLVPSFSQESYWVGALVPAFILSISGAIKFITEKTIALFEKVTFLQNFKIVEIILLAILATIILNYSSIIIRKIKNKNDLEKATESGEKIARQMTKMEIMSEFNEYKLDK